MQNIRLLLLCHFSSLMHACTGTPAPEDSMQAYIDELPAEENQMGSMVAPATVGVMGFGLTSADQLSKMPLSALKFPNPKRDGKNQELIRVRVYPHFDGTKFKDDQNMVALQGNCSVYAGAKSSSSKKGKKNLKTVQSLNLSIKALKAPFWLECSQPVKIVRQSGFTSHSYAGNFYIHVNRDGKAPFVEVINVVPIETYLRGVVPTEVIPSWPIESLKAQAVAARTYAYYNIASIQTPSYGVPPKHAKFYDVDDTSFFQAYSGLTNIYPDTDKAIAETAGQMLSYSGKILLSWFHADAGGHTENAGEVFGLNAPYCKGKQEPFESNPSKSQWTLAIPTAEVSQALSIGTAQIKGVSIAGGQRNATGRVNQITFETSSGKKVVPARLLKSKFRKILSYMFDARLEKDKVIITGRGSGHGVGMSQKGAKELAVQKKWNYQQILGFYYSDAKLCSLSDGKDLPKCRG